MPYNTNAIPPRKEPTGQTQLPLSRVKKIISQDSDIHTCSNNAAFVITIAAELFLQHLTETANTLSKLERKPRRNIQYKDVANAISHHDNLEFLEDIVPRTVPYKAIKGKANATRALIKSDKTREGQAVAQDVPEANGTGSVIVDGEGSAFTLPARGEERADDPNEQLELEMRQASGARDEDVRMSG